jgi:hypothetical protein
MQFVLLSKKFPVHIFNKRNVGISTAMMVKCMVCWAVTKSNTDGVSYQKGML